MILLCGMNATYQYPSLGLRYLWANMGELKEQTVLREFTIKQNLEEVVRQILEMTPQIVAIGAYIWNIDRVNELACALKTQAPHIHLVLGGPEVSYELEGQTIGAWADVVVQGEGDFIFAEHCRKYLAGEWQEEVRPQVLRGILPEVGQIIMHYDLYTDDDLKNRHICVEASRGCPFKCQYCLSSLDKSVRSFPMDKFLLEMKLLFERGARNFKFIDRTFNLSPAFCDRILRFFLDYKDSGIFLHFEMVPDRLPLGVRDLIKQFPSGVLQFEIGLQTLNEDIAKRVSRNNVWEKVVENFKYLTEETKVHIHADLILGLPGEDLISFGQGFDRLQSLRPHEIQLGILKRLKGTPITQQTQEWGMVYSTQAPFQIQETKVLPRQEVKKMEHYAKYWDRVHNSGDFPRTIEIIWNLAKQRADGSTFWEFMDLVNYIDEKIKRPYKLALLDLTKVLFDYLVEWRQLPRNQVRTALAADYELEGLRKLPFFLRDGKRSPMKQNQFLSQSINKRQVKAARHSRATDPT